MNMLTKFDCSGQDLTSVPAALALLTSSFSPLPAMESVSLYAALGRVLAHDAVAPLPMPMHDNSAMDGFAFSYPDDELMPPLAIVGNAAAGSRFTGFVQAGECVQIATGALLPAGCDSVIAREQCWVEDRHMFLRGQAGKGSHIRKQGEDFRKADLLLPEGTRLTPQDIGLLAAAGIGRLAVRPGLRVAVFSIGNELRESGDHLPDGGIFDANRMMLLAYCRKLDIAVTDLGIVPDDRRAIAGLLERAARSHDAVIASAGTSHGKEDHVADAIGDCGGEIILPGVAIKPGRPVMFGRLGDTPLVCLPGNPVAAITTFLVLAVPLLRRLGGERQRPKWRGMRAAFGHRKKRGVQEYLRVTIRSACGGVPEAERFSKQGSAMLTSLAASDGLLCLDETIAQVEPGMILPYQSFSDFLESR